MATRLAAFQTRVLKAIGLRSVPARLVGIRSAQWSGSAARIALRVPPRSWKPITLGRASRITSLMSWAIAARLMVFFRLSDATRKPGAAGLSTAAAAGAEPGAGAAGAEGAVTSAAPATIVVTRADRRTGCAEKR